MRFLFRCDGNSQIGSGHLSRCLTLALALRKKGASCRFVCREHSRDMAARIVAQGFEVLFLSEKRGSAEADAPVLAHANWLGTDWHTDADQTIVALGDSRPDWLIVDHYALDARWESTLRPYCGKIMVIDDLADRRHDCDLLLDQNLVANMQGRYEGLLPEHATQMIGPSWALLQSDYAYWHPRTPPRIGPVKRILVYFGGADQQNLTGKTIASFLALQRTDIQLDVVITPFGAHATTIQHQIEGHPNIILHGSLPSLAPLMLQADLAIGAGGSTSWERCCMGLPAIIITLAENQRPIAAALHEQGYLEWLGDQEAVSEAMITQKSQEWLSREDLEASSVRCRELVDGRGADKVSDILLIDEHIALNMRRAVLSDEHLILKWANDPAARKYALNAGTITAESHRQWFYKRLREPHSCFIFIAETPAGFPVGMVRFEQKNQGWEISYSLDPLVRGRKLGSRLLLLALQALSKTRGNCYIYGKVKADNIASKRVFEKLGFKLNAKEDDVLIFHNHLESIND